MKKGMGEVSTIKLIIKYDELEVVVGTITSVGCDVPYYDLRIMIEDRTPDGKYFYQLWVKDYHTPDGLDDIKFSYEAYIEWPASTVSKVFSFDTDTVDWEKADEEEKIYLTVEDN